MKTKSLRIPENMINAIKLLEKEEKIEESTAIRKLMRIGIETYVGNLYRQGRITLREAASLLNINQAEAIDLFLDLGIKGNLDASDVMVSLRKFTKK